jgi:hypothetical protein
MEFDNKNSDFVKNLFLIFVSVAFSILIFFSYIKYYGLEGFGYKRDVVETKIAVLNIDESIKKWGGYKNDEILSHLKKKVDQLAAEGYFVYELNGNILNAPDKNYLVLGPSDLGMKEIKDGKLDLPQAEIDFGINTEKLYEQLMPNIISGTNTNGVKNEQK